MEFFKLLFSYCHCDELKQIESSLVVFIFLYIIIIIFVKNFVN